MIDKNSVDIFEKVKHSVDIEQVIEEFSGIELKRKGNKLFGCCPFHDDKSPSFVVYPDKNDFYCFGCGVGGDSINFVEKLLNIRSFEAAKLISDRFGVDRESIDGNLARKIVSVRTKVEQEKQFKQECSEKYNQVLDEKKHIENLARKGLYTTPKLIFNTIHLEDYLDILLFGDYKDKLKLLKSKDIDKTFNILRSELTKCKEKGFDWVKEIYVEKKRNKSSSRQLEMDR